MHMDRSKNVNVVKVYAKYDTHFWIVLIKCVNNNNMNNNNIISF